MTTTRRFKTKEIENIVRAYEQRVPEAKRKRRKIVRYSLGILFALVVIIAGSIFMGRMIARSQLAQNEASISQTHSIVAMRNLDEQIAHMEQKLNYATSPKQEKIYETKLSHLVEEKTNLQRDYH